MNAATCLVPMLAFALSGCLGGGSQPDETGALDPAPGATAVPMDGDGADNATLPTLGPPFDPWLPNETERVLFEGTVDVDPTCMCGDIELADGTKIPEGTVAVRIEADATEALRAGTFYAYLYTAGRYTDEEADGAPTSDKVHTWEFPLGPRDWDPPWLEDSFADLGYWSIHTTELGLYDSWAVFYGPVGTKVVAVRDPTWRPAAPIDHWNLTALHDIPQPGVVTVMNQSFSWSQPGRVVAFGVSEPSREPPTFTDRIPLGTANVVLGLHWTPIAGCPPAIECRPWANANQGGRFVSGFDWIVEEGPTHLLIVWPVPDSMWAEPDYVPANQTRLSMFVTMMCPGGGTCGFPPTATTTTVTILAEAWRGDVDLAAFKDRHGVA